MDLYAFAQIPDYENILEEKGINIPRLRGIRKMSEEQICTKEEILDDLVKEYDAPKEEISKDLDEFLNDLIKNKIVYEQ